MNLWSITVAAVVVLKKSAIVLVVIFNIMQSKKKNLPPGPFNLPFVGYLPFLGQQPHITFKKLTEKYGPVFSLRLGMAKAVVITNYDIMKETFSKSETLSRPPNFAYSMPDELGLTSVNGHEWVAQRKYTIKTMGNVGLGKSKWQGFVQEEVDEFVQLLEKQKEKPFNPKDSLIASIANNVFSLVFGYRLPHESTKMSVIIQALHSFPGFFDQAGLFGIPGLLLFFKITGLSQGLKDMIAFNNLLRSEVNKKKKEMNETNETCFAEDYLKIMKEEESKKEPNDHDKLILLVTFNL
ncbi:UNVERIFIED_CONTAM: Cyp2j6 [Trichonephila clavipes]